MPTITSFEPPKLGPRSDADVFELRRNILKYGHEVEWQMATVCPCGRKMSGTSNQLAAGGLPTGTSTLHTIDTREKRVSCTECKGSGVLYHSKQTIKALVLDASRDPDRWRLYGEHATGSLQFTTLPEHLPGFADRFVLKTNVMVYRERRKREGSTDSLRYPIVTRTIDVGTEGSPSVATTQTLNVLSCRKADSTGTIVSGELQGGVDFVITSDGKIDWTGGSRGGSTAPAVGDYYSVHYYIHPVYVVKTFPYQFRDTLVKRGGQTSAGTKTPAVRFESMPTKCLAWLEFLGETDG